MTRATIIIPEQADNYLTAKGLVQRQLADTFGGWTATHGHGGWVNDNGETVQEPVRILEVYTEKSKPSVMLFMENLAYHVKELTGESAVMFTVNHDHMLVD